jgi:tRNA(Ile)-lysidine synthase
MVLLDAAGVALGERVAAVATFNHRTGPHAAEAVGLVQREAASRGFRVVTGHASADAGSEAGWRAARWEFLAAVSRSEQAAIVTGHTRDDHLETVCQRVLRGSGARGLAGLHAPSPVIRPFLEVKREALERYAASHGVSFAEDPTNASPAYFRNRIRHDLLPAIAAVDPGFAGDMLRLASQAAEVRRALDAVAPRLAIPESGGGVSVRLDMLTGLRVDALRALVPAVAALAGIVLDRRGTLRLAEFILSSQPGTRIQLSGGFEAVRSRDIIRVRRARLIAASESEHMLDGSCAFGSWRLRRVSSSRELDVWAAELPADRALSVRAWRPGDRMRVAGTSAARRVKRFLRDAGIAGPDRAGWPVVLADGEIVWIPGVRRSDAATDRSGRPVLRYRCDRNDV